MNRRALVCAPVLPEHDRESGSRRIFHLIDMLLSDHWHVSFIAENPTGERRYVRQLQQRGVATYCGFTRVAHDVIAAGAFDLTLFAFWHMADRYGPLVRRLCPGTRVVVDSIDLNWLRSARRLFRFGADGGGPRALTREYADEMIREMNAYAAADGVLTVSDKEADLINDITGNARLAHAVPDHEDQPLSNVPFGERRGIVFLGNFRHPPNVDAVEHLLQDILPLLPQEVLHDHPVRIVGNGIPTELMDRARDLDAVRIVGWVPSVDPYLQHARLSVLPLRYGAGTKRKLIQSLLIGTPTVSTSIGIEGLPVTTGEHVLVADEPAAFADAIVGLATDESLWSRLQQQARAQMVSAHGRVHARNCLRRALSVFLAGSARRPRPESTDGARRHDAPAALSWESLPGLSSRSRLIVVGPPQGSVLGEDRHRVWSFLDDQDGDPRGYYPVDARAAVSRLETLRSRGGEFLLFTGSTRWWLDHYPEFREYLERRYRSVARDEADYVLFDLRTVRSPHR